MAKKSVVIIGGGGAGARAARALSGKLNATQYSVTLITPRPFYLHWPAVPRMLVTAEGSLEDRALISYDNLFVKGNGTLKIGVVERIQADKERGGSGSVVLRGGETIGYDVLVLATGSNWEGALAFPESKRDFVDWLNAWREKFKRSKEIVFLGGGAVGMELAGEIKDFFPQKSVTIVHNSTALANSSYPDKFRQRLDTALRNRGVNLILEDYIEEAPAFDGQLKTLKTEKGKEITADLVVPTRGGRPNTAFIGASLGADVLTAAGHVRILPTMQLLSYPNIFAAGDIMDFPEQKQVGKMPAHLAVLAPNVASAIQGQPVTKEYKGTTEIIAISLGRTGGVGFFNMLWGIVTGDFLTSYVKSRHLFIWLTSKELGQ